MWLFEKLKRQRIAPRGQRGEDRFETDLLRCELGEVLDISGSGMRVRSEKGKLPKVGAVLSLTLRSSQCQVTLKSRIVRVKRTGLRSGEIGLKFDGIKPSLKNALNHLGRYGFLLNWRAASSSEGEAGASLWGRSRKSLPDHYRILQVEPTATAKEIRDAYRRLAREHHPDASKTADSAEQFNKLTEAYRTLRNVESRAKYDQRRISEQNKA